jgi:putative transposase
MRAGAKAADLARKHGISQATLYNWKARYGGVDVSEAKRLKALEEESAKLKKLLAEQMLDAAAPGAPVKKMVGPAAKRAAVRSRINFDASHFPILAPSICPCTRWHCAFERMEDR